MDLVCPQVLDLSVEPTVVSRPPRSKAAHGSPPSLVMLEAELSQAPGKRDGPKVRWGVWSVLTA